MEMFIMINILVKHVDQIQLSPIKSQVKHLDDIV